MGVTLERVQNKFACIIGELCSEPDILSEFAIWLDLRLAEYKAKGALQLECSGKSPDPTWLRGHKKSAKSLKPQYLEVPHQFDTARQYIEDKSHEVLERLSPEIVRVKEEPSDSSSAFIPLEKLSRFDSVPQYTEDRSHEVCERLSPENVCVKEEPSGSSDIFPVNIYCHEYSSHVTNTSRKRTLTDSCSNKHSVENIPLKMQRLLPSSSVLEPVNQILMSIISENTADDSADLSSNLSADRSNIGSCIKLENSTPVPSSDRPPSTSSSKPTNHQDRNKSGLDCQCSGRLDFNSGRTVNIGNVGNPVIVDSLRYERTKRLPTAQRYILAAMDLVFNEEEMSISSVCGGTVRYNGQDIVKLPLCVSKLNTLFHQAALLFDRNEDFLKADVSLRNAINSKCRTKRAKQKKSSNVI